MASINIADKYIDKKKDKPKSLLAPLQRNGASGSWENESKPLDTEKEEAIQKQVMAETTAANTQPSARQQLKQDMQKANSSKQEERSGGQENNGSSTSELPNVPGLPEYKPETTPEGKERERNTITDGLRDALLYFGPRLGAMMLGGTEAANMTDNILNKWEAHKQNKRESNIAEREMALKERNATQKQGSDLQERKFQYQQERDIKQDEMTSQQIQEKKQANLDKLQADRAKSIEDINSQLSQIVEAKSYLKDESMVGPIAGTAGSWIDKLSGSKSGSRREAGRKLLQQMVVDETLANSMKLSGAINNEEFKFLKSSVLNLSDDNNVWNDVLSRKQAILEKGLAKLKAEGQGQEAPQSSRFRPGQIIRSKSTGKTYKIMPDGSRQEIN